MTLGMRTRSRVSVTTSSGWMRARTSFTETSTAWVRALLVRKRQDDGVEADDAELVARDVEVMALDFLGALFEGDHGLNVRHLAEGVGALVEAVSTRHNLSVANQIGRASCRERV